jgi:1-deoxy-D-xylulose-5-phosphate synthase
MAEPTLNSPHHPVFDECPLLAGLDLPDAIKTLSESDLDLLAQEVRRVIIDVASRNGGHLASPLGAVELTVALHYVFDPRDDLIVWDVGHQSHAHKILTDRRDRIHTIRRKGGLSGYPKRSESEFDCFGTGHSSTSISAALGMAVARDLRGEDRHVIAVIGDGAMTGGMAMEALSHAGHLKRRLLVILNDNEMSISRNVGALSSYLSRLITNGLYNRARGDLKSFMRAMGESVMGAARRVEHGFKGMFIPGGFFEELGFRYVGPVDGNDVHTLIQCFENLKNIDGPILFHCVTQKGKGYPYAEDDPLTYHGVNPYEISTGKFLSSGQKEATPVPSFTEAFASALIDCAKEDDRIVAITAAMPTGTGISKFEEHFPDRCFDVGICEQHAVTFAAGLATQGFRPVAAIYSTFLQRGYDQLIHDVCLQNLPVVFAIDRAGLVGEDSPTQQGAFDLSFLRAVPNLKILAPRDDVDTKLMLEWALRQEGPVAIRYARAKAPTIGAATGRNIDHGEIVKEGSDGFFLAIGPSVGTCLRAAEILQSRGYTIGVADARFVKPLDGGLINQIAHAPIITVEENTLAGGIGSAVLEYFEQRGTLGDVRVKRLGFPDRFLDHATRDQQIMECGLDAEGLARSAAEFLGARAPQAVV